MGDHAGILGAVVFLPALCVSFRAGSQGLAAVHEPFFFFFFPSSAAHKIKFNHRFLAQFRAGLHDLGALWRQVRGQSTSQDTSYKRTVLQLFFFFPTQEKGSEQWLLNPEFCFLMLPHPPVCLLTLDTGWLIV